MYISDGKSIGAPKSLIDALEADRASVSEEIRGLQGQYGQELQIAGQT